MISAQRRHLALSHSGGPNRSRAVVRRATTAQQQQHNDPQNQEASYSYRRAANSDVEFITKRLLLESMNPLGVTPENFTVVQAADGSGMLGFGQLAPLSAQPDTLELRSLVVLPEHRGKGIGRGLLQHLVARAPGTAQLYLTTLRRTTRFYEAAGFKLLQAGEVPWFLWFEAAAGTLLARIAAGDQLVVMLRPGSSGSSSAQQ